MAVGTLVFCRNNKKNGLYYGFFSSLIPVGFIYILLIQVRRFLKNMFIVNIGITSIMDC